VLVINARRHRTQERNREDTRECLFDLIRRAAVAPRARRSTKPSAAARERRLESKKRRSAIKGLRRTKPSLDERVQIGFVWPKGLHALLGERPSHFCLPHGPRAIEKIDHFGFVLPKSRHSQLLVVQRKFCNRKANATETRSRSM
jgi:hypothetical protein